MIKRLLFGCFSVLLISILFILITFLAQPNNFRQIPYLLDEEEENYYQSLIDYGILELKIPFNAEVSEREEHVLQIPKNAILECKIGKVEKAELLYKDNNKDVYADTDMEIFSISYEEDEIFIRYFIPNKDYVIFYGNKYDYFNIHNGMSVTCLSGEGLHTKIARKELFDGVSVFYTESGDYGEYVGKEFVIDVSIKTINDCYFIRNEYLGATKQDGQYVLHIMNEYDGDTITYYDKLITAYKFNNEYSIITSNNVSVYEKVFCSK